MHGSARTFAAIIRLLMDEEWSKSAMTERSGLHHVTSARYINALHDARVIRISSWQRGKRGHLVPYYSFNKTGHPDAKRPTNNAMTRSELSRQYRARKAEIRRHHLIAGKIE